MTKPITQSSDQADRVFGLGIPSIDREPLKELIDVGIREESIVSADAFDVDTLDSYLASFFNDVSSSPCIDNE